MRDHKPVEIDKFNGLWRRGSAETTPIDHFSDSNNIRHIGTGEFGTRYGVGIHQTVAVPLSNVKRFYNYSTPNGNTLIVLTIDGTDGKIYHVVNAATVHGPLLTIAGMTDFAFVAYAGRAYISPIATYVEGELNLQKGMNGEFVYVYMGDGTAARKAAGSTPAGTVTIANGAAGFTDNGRHIFGVVGETNSGFLSRPVALNSFVTSPNFALNFSTVPVFTGTQWVKRHIVGSKVLPTFNGNLEGYDLFFIEGATIPDNITTTLNGVSFYDADLLDDASHLIDNYTEIPAGASLSFYHNRLCVGGTYNDQSIFLVSAVGEPEAISQIEGILVMPLDGNPITNGQELRDIFYAFKRAKTGAFVDNGDEPATWPYTVIDNAIGCPIHGIATVLDSGASSVDYLIVASYMGIMLFNGKYVEQALTWKIEDYWNEEDKNEYGKIQIVNDVSGQQILTVLPSGVLLSGNYANGMSAKGIRWEPWTFARNINTVAVVNIEDIILGMDLQ